MSNLMRMTTPELRVGDIVHEHGMRIHLTREPYTEQCHRMVYGFVGDVLNPDEVIAAGVVSKAFLGDSEWVDGEGWVWKQHNRWTVQGNDLALWLVERPDAATA